MDRRGHDGRDNGSPGGAAAAGMLPAVTRGRARGHEWVAHVDFGEPGEVQPYIPGMTLRWRITVNGVEGPAVQLIGPPESGAALSQLAHLVDAWLSTHPPSESDT